MRFYAKRTVCGTYALEQERDDGMVYRQIIGRDSVNPVLRAKLDANIGERVEFNK